MNKKVVFFVLIVILSAGTGCFAKAGNYQPDTLNWDYVIRQDWRRPEKLDSFVGVHPRYLLNKARLELLRVKIKTTGKELWDIVKARADEYASQEPPTDYSKSEPLRIVGWCIPWMAMAYQLTGDSVYLDGAKKWMLTACREPKWRNGKNLAAGECLFGVAIGYDWLYNYLSDEERNIVRDKLILQASLMKNGPPQHYYAWLGNHNIIEHSALAAAGLVLYDEVPKAIDWIRQGDLALSQTLKVYGDDGSTDEGHQYWVYSTEALLCYLEAARDLMGLNYYDNDWLENTADFAVFCTTPDFNTKTCVMSYGDSARQYGPRNPVHILYRLASEYNNGFAQRLAEEMMSRKIGKKGRKAWLNLLWYDETVKPVDLSGLGTFRHFDNIGFITTRSSWNEDAVMIGFKCGPFHGQKLQAYYEGQADNGWHYSKIKSGGHCHPDINSFQVYAYGKWLAIDPGFEKPKWTKNHNTILVNGCGQLGEGKKYFDRETVFTARAKSTIIKAENNKAFDYIIGDAGNIYPASTGLKKFYRHLLYIKPDVILVVDELEAEKPSEFEWRLHAEESVEKVSNNYCIVKTGDVVMDSHFVFPETIEAEINGRFLRALPEKTNKTVIAAVLHPRRTTDKASRARLVSFKDSVIDLSVETGRKKTEVLLDLSGRQVTLR